MIQQPAARASSLAEEYRAGREGAGIAALERGTLEVSGPKRQDYLHAMLSNEVSGLKPGEGRRAASMSAKGSLSALVRVLVDASAVTLETERERLAPLLRTLEHHRVGAPVRFATPAVVVLAVIGPRASETLAGAGAPRPPAEPESHLTASVGGQPVRVIRASDLPGGGFVLHAPPEAEAPVRAALEGAGALPLGPEAISALRIEALCPWYGADVSEDNLLHETGLVGALHSSTKGCYVGQEVIARLEGRGGNVNKALRGLRLSLAAAPGTPLLAGGREVGWLTTCAVSPRHGPIALGYVQRSHFAAGTRLDAGGGEAVVVTSFEAASGQGA